MTLAIAKKTMYGVKASNGSLEEEDFLSPFRHQIPIPTAAVTATNAHGTLTLATCLNKPVKVVGLTFCHTGTTFAASSTNYLSVELSKMATDGSTTTLVGSVSSAASATTSKIAKAGTVTTNNTAKAEETLYYQMVKGDITTTGVSVTAGILTIEVEEID